MLHRIPEISCWFPSWFMPRHIRIKTPPDGLSVGLGNQTVCHGFSRIYGHLGLFSAGVRTTTPELNAHVARGAHWSDSLHPELHMSPSVHTGRYCQGSRSIKSGSPVRGPNLLRSLHECLRRPDESRARGNASGRMVFCQKFQREMPGLDAPPWPGELGQRDLRQHLGRGVEAVGRTDEDDPQRVPPDALAERGAANS